MIYSDSERISKVPKVTKVSKETLKKYYVYLNELAYYNDINPKEYEKRVHLLKKQPPKKKSKDVWLRKEDVKYVYVVVNRRIKFPHITENLKNTKIKITKKTIDQYGAKIEVNVFRIPIKVLQKNFKGILFRSPEGYDMFEVALKMYTHGKNEKCKIEVDYY